MSTIRLDPSHELYAGSATESPQLCHFSNNDFDGKRRRWASFVHREQALDVQAIFEVSRFC
jgi:hypothetical protein